MREIKFRAWNKTRKEMGKVLNIVDLNEMILVVGYDDGTCSDLFISDNEGVLMQYTGLKDKHGNEIYEGDIVSGIELDGVIIAKCVIEFRLGCFCLKVSNGVYPFLLINCKLEVIGNIYENPELLKQVK